MIETEFMRGISLESDPFEEEAPDQEIFYDKNGKEVKQDGSQ